MTGRFADRLFLITFALAGAYNLAFGLWAALWPGAFFDWFDIEPPRYPGIWACLGMVVGVYGLLYWHAAWNLAAAKPIIAVGLLGKVLGPIGMWLSFGVDWPRRLGLICIYNDLIWWLPFGLFLVRGTAFGRWIVRAAPWICVVLHTVALAAIMVVLQPGSLIEPVAVERATYIGRHAVAWSAAWGAWMLAAMSLIGFYAWWGSRLQSQPVGMAAVLVAAAGMVFDFSGEALSALVLVERAPSVGVTPSVIEWDASHFMQIERLATLLTAGAANGLYTLGGILLTLATSGLPPWVRAAMWGTWLAGAAMTVAGVMNHVGGMIAATALLFPLLISWVAWMGTNWSQAPSKSSPAVLWEQEG